MSPRLVHSSLLGPAFVLLSLAGHAQQPVTAPAAPLATATATAPTTNQAAATPPVDPSSHMMAKAIGQVNSNDLPGAMASLTEAIKLNPKNSAAYVLRASLYCQKMQWAQAEEDFKAALAIDPKNVVLKFNLVELKFMQKQYDAARPEFVALEKDPDLGDVAAFDVFLCDLAGGHEALAKKELDAFNEAGSKPSYYFSNAAWCIAHKKYDEARSWRGSAGHIYAKRKNDYYDQGLLYLGYLPIPPAAAPQ